MTSVSADNFKKTVNINNKDYELVLAKIIPNATEVVADNPEGEPLISLLVTKDMMSQETVMLKKGDLKSAEGISIGFDSPGPADINITIDSGTFYIRSGLRTWGDEHDDTG